MQRLNQRQDKIVRQFEGLTDWEERYKKLIQLGKELPPLDESLRVPENLVKGCQSQVWFHASLDDSGRIVFKADSDALIVRGLVALLLQAYNEASPDEILSTPPDFVSRLNLGSHLSQSRANGLHAMIKQMMYYATAFKAMARA